MDVNIYCLELMLILLNIYQPWKLMKKFILAETLFLRRKDKKHQKKKNLVVNLLELTQEKKAMMETMKPAEYKHFKKLSKKLRKLNKKLKELEDKIEQIDRLNHSIKQITKLQTIKN